MPQPDNPKTGWSLIDEDEYPNEFEGVEEKDLVVLDRVRGSNGWAVGERTQDTKPPLLKKAGTLVSKEKETTVNVTVKGVVQTIYDSFVGSCSCPM